MSAPLRGLDELRGQGNVGGLAMLKFVALAKQTDFQARHQSSSRPFGRPRGALRSTELLARRGNARAEALLDFMYEHGLGVPQSWPAAIDHYLVAAEKGDPSGQYLLGLMYDKGFGTSRDVVLAYKWLDLAAGHAPRQNREYFMRFRDAVPSKMTRAQIDLGQQLALEWSLRAGWRSPAPKQY